MLVNVSYNKPELKRKINMLVGEPFTLSERFKLNGIGSGKININSACLAIHNLLILDNNQNCCNIELRPKGILVGFRSLLESYALVIPYYKLVLYKGKSQEYSIYMDHYFLKLKADRDKTHKFIKKVMQQKVLACS